jgi:hypothetical protein
VCCFEQGQSPASEQEQCCGLNKGSTLLVNMSEIMLLNKPNVGVSKKVELERRHAFNYLIINVHYIKLWHMHTHPTLIYNHARQSGLLLTGQVV